MSSRQFTREAAGSNSHRVSDVKLLLWLAARNGVRPCDNNLGHLIPTLHSARAVVQPFWEEGYRNPHSEVFGPASAEIVELIARLPWRAKALDLGCGDGRNALPLACAGFEVHAIDQSEAGIERLLQRAAQLNVTINTRVLDLADYSPDQYYDLVIAHGVLHLLKPPHGLRLIGEGQAATRRGGWNVHVVFTDRLPQPPDLAPFVHRVFREGELSELYNAWDIESFRSYILEDEHPGGLRHRHAVNKIVARRR